MKWKVWTNATDFTAQSPGWNTSLAYATTVWSNGTSGLGWDDNPSPVDFTPYFGNNANPRSLISGQSRALFCRCLPVLTNVASAAGLKLRMKFDDGFAAWLNGTLVASNLAPATPSWGFAGDGHAGRHTECCVGHVRSATCCRSRRHEPFGDQTFNTTTSSDLLLLPELDLLLSGSGSGSAAYLNAPTPSAHQWQRFERRAARRRIAH